MKFSRQLISCFVVLLSATFPVLAQGDNPLDYPSPPFPNSLDFPGDPISPPPASDDTPPVLQSFSFTPTSVDVTSGQQSVTVTTTATDDLSGVAYGYALFFSPSGRKSISTSFSPTSGTDPNNSTLTGTLYIPQFSEAGDWKLAQVSVFDKIGNRQNYYWSQWGFSAPDFPLPSGIQDTLDVESPGEDATPPVLQSFSFTPSSVDVTSGQQSVTVTTTATDDLSGVAYGYALFFSPSGRKSISTSFSPTSGTDPNNSTLTGTLYIPQFSEAGDWKLAQVSVFDKIGNRQNYYWSQWGFSAPDLPLPSGIQDTLGVNLSIAPAVSITTADVHSSSTATLHGSVLPRGSSTEYTFEYGPTLSFGRTISTSAGSGNQEVPVAAEISDLLPSTRYYWRLYATNASGTAYTQTRSFITYGSAVSAGYGHSLFLKPDGTAWTAGLDNGGPTPVQALDGVSAIAAGGYHSLFVKSDGSAWASGTNDSGQLGDGTTESKSAPVQVLTDVQAVAAGSLHSLFLKTDGTVWACGSNGSGQLGDGTQDSRSSPVLVMSGVKAIAAGAYHSLFLKTDGTVCGTGRNGNGQLGYGTSTLGVITPVQVFTGAQAISAGSYHTLFLKADGSVWATGLNTNGQLGDGSSSSQLSPVQVLSYAKGIAAGYYHSFFIRSDNSLWAAGGNHVGQLGDGTTSGKITPVQVASDVQAASGGNAHSLFIKTDGTFWAMGANAAGQLGDLTTFIRTIPVQIFAPTAPPPVLKVADAPGTTYENGFPPGSLFGYTQTPPGTSQDLTLYLRNDGGSPLTDVEVSLIGLEADQYSITLSDNSPITPGASVPFTIRFAPNSTGIKSAQINITSNDPSGPEVFYIQALANTQPTFVGYSASTPAGAPITLSFAKLKTKASDADGEPLTFDIVAPGSTEGGTVALVATGIQYTPPAGFSGTDTFDIFVNDPHALEPGGGPTLGTVTITVTGSSGGTGGPVLNPPVLTMQPDGKVGLSFQGIPGRTYLVQRSTDMTQWNTLTTAVANASGAISFVDESPPPGSAFYRIAKP